MALIKGIISFPVLFTPKSVAVTGGSSAPRYSCALLLNGTDPQIAIIQNEIAVAKQNSFPNGYTGVDECLAPYDVKFAGKDYYKSEFSGYWVWTVTCKENAKPAVVDGAHTPIIDPGVVYPGMVVYVNANIAGYTSGRGGVGAFLNGVMITDEPPPMGRLDSKPTVQQMFQQVPQQAPQQQVPQQQVPQQAPQQQVPQQMFQQVPQQMFQQVPQQQQVYTMTPAANGFTRDQMMAAGWTDTQLIQGGMMLPPAGMNLSFV